MFKYFVVFQAEDNGIENDIIDYRRIEGKEDIKKLKSYYVKNGLWMVE